MAGTKPIFTICNGNANMTIETKIEAVVEPKLKKPPVPPPPSPSIASMYGERPSYSRSTSVSSRFGIITPSTSLSSIFREKPTPSSSARPTPSPSMASILSEKPSYPPPRLQDAFTFGERPPPSPKETLVVDAYCDTPPRSPRDHIVVMINDKKEHDRDQRRWKPPAIKCLNRWRSQAHKYVTKEVTGHITSIPNWKRNNSIENYINNTPPKKPKTREER